MCWFPRLVYDAFDCGWQVGHYFLDRERFMNTFPVLLGALCVYAIAYRYYSAFIAAKALAL